MSHAMRRAVPIAFATALALSSAPLLLDAATPASGEASDAAMLVAMASAFPALGQGILIVSAVAGGLLLSWLSERLLPTRTPQRRWSGAALAVLAPGAALTIWFALMWLYGPQFRACAVLSGVHVLMAACASVFARHLVIGAAADPQPFGRSLS